MFHILWTVIEFIRNIDHISGRTKARISQGWNVVDFVMLQWNLCKRATFETDLSGWKVAVL